MSKTAEDIVRSLVLQTRNPAIADAFDRLMSRGVPELPEGVFAKIEDWKDKWSVQLWREKIPGDPNGNCELVCHEFGPTIRAACEAAIGCLLER